MKDFADKTFRDIMEKMENEEYDTFQKEIVNRSDRIMDVSKIQAEKKDGVNVDRLSAVVVLSGNMPAFVALTGTLMQLCFHIGYKAGIENVMAKEGKK